MSFLSSISGIKLDSNLLVTLNVPNILGDLLVAFQRIYDSMSIAIRNFTLVEKDIFFKVKENWNFEEDPTTGINFLKIEHDDSAISKTRNILHDLFK